MSNETCNACWSTTCLYPGQDKPGCLVTVERETIATLTHPNEAPAPAKLESRKSDPLWGTWSPDVRHWLPVAGLVLALVALCFLAPVVVP